MKETLRLALPTDRLTTDQRAFFAALGARARIDIEPLAIMTHAGLCAAVESGAAQLVWAPPLLALDLDGWGSASPLATVVRGGRTSYPAVLVARHDEDLEGLEDLAGSRVAWVSRLSAAGYVVPRIFLESSRMMPSRCFREQQFFHTHEGVLRAIQQGAADVGATCARVSRSSGALSLPPGGEGLRIVAVAGFVPGEVIMATRAVSALSRLSLGEALRRLGASELRLLGESLGVERFSLNVEGHLAPLARMTSHARRSDVALGLPRGDLASELASFGG